MISYSNFYHVSKILIAGFKIPIKKFPSKISIPKHQKILGHKLP